MQKHVNLVDLVKSFPTNIYLQKLASIQKRTSPVKFAHVAEKSGSALRYRTFQPFGGSDGVGARRRPAAPGGERRRPGGASGRGSKE